MKKIITNQKISIQTQNHSAKVSQIPDHNSCFCGVFVTHVHQIQATLACAWVKIKSVNFIF